MATISELNIYPLKSGRAIAQQQAPCQLADPQWITLAS